MQGHLSLSLLSLPRPPSLSLSPLFFPCLPLLLTSPPPSVSLFLILSPRRLHEASKNGWRCRRTHLRADSIKK